MVETAPHGRVNPEGGEGEIWLPRTFEVRSVATAVVKTLRKRNRWTYSDFVKAPARSP